MSCIPPPEGCFGPTVPKLLLTITTDCPVYTQYTYGYRLPTRPILSRVYRSGQQYTKDRQLPEYT